MGPPKKLSQILIQAQFYITSQSNPSLYKNCGWKILNCTNSKGEGLPRQAEVALGVPDRLRPRIFSTFGTTRVVGRQPKGPAAFTPGEIPGTHFQRLSRPQGT